MLIKQCKGYELEKEKSNTSEDFFNRSEMIFEEDGQEKTLHILYVRYFDEFIQEFTPFETSPLFTVGSREVEFRDIVALVCLLKNPGFRHRKRVYINTKNEFASYFKDIDYAKLPAIFEDLETKKSHSLRSPLDYIVQPQ
ncbi:hypothetical protein ACFYKT_04405 [Cytobacillus sp. FJAT-53684]|uniref:Uncharacterized protein n=1 Tax=Cytobacillus mangrovibacter TaxID=3299024 RepID=A0ABW6JWZ7_9BACI